MYRLSIPIAYTSLDAQSRETYLRQCREAGADRVFIGAGEVMAFKDADFDALGDHLRFFAENGLETGIWINTNGHGVVLAHDPALGSARAKYAPMIRLDGKPWEGACCPLDPVFRADLLAAVRRVAALRPDILMLDDDFRLSQHHPEFCCVCERHMAKIRACCGEEISREQVRGLCFSGGPNKYRDAWLHAEGESLYELARLIRAAVDEVDPAIRVALCASNTIWDVDGTDAVELARTLAGGTKPLLRLTGAPYATVSRSGKTFTMALEVARALASITRGEGVELMAEDDVYPRPRYNVPAVYSEIYDMVMRLDGHYDGVLKYMIDYVSPPDYETGYLDRHNRNKPLYGALERLFSGTEPCGVNVLFRRHLMRGADYALAPVSYYSPFPAAGLLLQGVSVPTVYGGAGICNAAFGEHARALTGAELGKGLLLDATAAEILQARGIDVGLRGKQTRQNGTCAMIYAADGIEKSCVWNGEGQYLKTALDAGAEVVLYALVDGEKLPYAYRYENAAGKRFFVLLSHAQSHRPDSGMLRGYHLQRAVTEGAEWVAGEKLPVKSPGNPGLYILAARGKNSLSVALFNCFADEITNPVVELDRAYARAEFLRCDGRLDGDRVTLSAPLPAFSYAFFKVTVGENFCRQCRTR